MDPQLAMMMLNVAKPFLKLPGKAGSWLNDKIHQGADKIGDYNHTGANILRGFGNLWETGTGLLGNGAAALLGDEEAQNWIWDGADRFANLTLGDAKQYGQNFSEQWDYLARDPGPEQQVEPVYQEPTYVDTTSMFDQYSYNQGGAPTGAPNTAFNSSGAYGTQDANPLRKKSRFGSDMSTGW